MRENQKIKAPVVDDSRSSQLCPKIVKPGNKVSSATNILLASRTPFNELLLVGILKNERSLAASRRCSENERFLDVITSTYEEDKLR